MRPIGGSEYRRNGLAEAWPGTFHASDSSAQKNTATGLSELAALAEIYGPFEWVALAYLVISSALIVILAKNLPHPLRLLCVQGLVALLILALCRAEANVWSPDSTSQMVADGRTAKNGCPTVTQRFWHFWRHWYPHLFFLFCFEELGALVHLVSPRWQDAKLIAVDHWLTGAHPAIWLEQFVTPGRNEFMQFAYLTYFVYLLVLGGILYYREDWHGYWSVMTYSVVAYAIGYVIAIFFPIESPWFAMAGSWQGPLHGGLFTAVINFIEHYGRVRGAAFPSAHVAGSFAALWGAWRHRRWLFWVMLPLVICMCVSTVWGRYHYVADIFGGIITGTLGYVIGKWLMNNGESVRVPQSTVDRESFALVRRDSRSYLRLRSSERRHDCLCHLGDAEEK
jgi:membrane-associated phospholipid phosphatase